MNCFQLDVDAVDPVAEVWLGDSVDQLPDADLLLVVLRNDSRRLRVELEFPGPAHLLHLGGEATGPYLDLLAHLEALPLGIRKSRLSLPDQSAHLRVQPLSFGVGLLAGRCGGLNGRS